MTTSLDFFKDCIDRDHNIKEQYTSMMHEYATQAERILGTYAEFVAYSYADGLKSAKETFDKLGLRSAHAYAILQDFENFESEFDFFERNEQEFDENY